MNVNECANDSTHGSPCLEQKLYPTLSPNWPKLAELLQHSPAFSLFPFRRVLEILAQVHICHGLTQLQQVRQGGPLQGGIGRMGRFQEDHLSW